jgi:restriction system protein
VKHRKDQKASRDDIAALRGILIPDREIGLFVASGGFTLEALREAMRASPHIRCMDLDQVIDTYVEHYEQLEERDRERIPLRRTYVYAPRQA